MTDIKHKVKRTVSENDFDMHKLAAGGTASKEAITFWFSPLLSAVMDVEGVD